MEINTYYGYYYRKLQSVIFLNHPKRRMQKGVFLKYIIRGKETTAALTQQTGLIKVGDIITAQGKTIEVTASQIQHPHNFGCHLERMLAAKLAEMGVEYQHESQYNIGLDFYLPRQKVYIEIKQYHTERIHRQIADKGDVIVLQGKKSVDFFIELLNNYETKHT